MKSSLILVFVFSLPFFSNAIAQDTLTDYQRAVAAFERRDFNKASALLNSHVKSNSKDADAWNLLGVSLVNLGNLKEGRKALEKAVKINPKSSKYKTDLSVALIRLNKTGKANDLLSDAIRLDKSNTRALYLRGIISVKSGESDGALRDAELAIRIDPTFRDAYLLKSKAFIGKFTKSVTDGAEPIEKIQYLQESGETLEECLKHCAGNLDEVSSELEAAQKFFSYFSRRDTRTDSPRPPDDPTVTPVTILSKARANYTNAARKNDVKGTVRLAVLFSADGKTIYAIPLTRLGHGLTEEAVIAAKKIRFLPQTKNGQPVSVVKIVEYSFALY